MLVTNCYRNVQLFPFTEESVWVLEIICARPRPAWELATTRSLYSSLLFPSVPGACFPREGRRGGTEGGDDMTRTQIFLGPFGCGPKIGRDRAKVGERRLAGRVMRMRAGIGSILRW